MVKYSIQVQGLQKSFGDVKVLENVSFKAEKGKILALLGPNGAGKTTTINILSTLLQPTGGSATIDGFDVVEQDDEVRARIGLTGQYAAIDGYLTGRENIRLIGQLYHLPSKGLDDKVTELLNKLDLTEAADRAANTYSGGMKRRLDLAMSLVATPPIIFLDEPTTGLDPRSRLALWRMIKQLAADGVTILLTTQYMEEAEFLSDNVIVLDHGRIIAEGTVNQLREQAGSQQVEVTIKNTSDVVKAQKLLKGSTLSEDGNNTLTLPAKDGVNSLKKSLDELQKAKIVLDGASLRRPTLDDVFLALTGRHASSVEEKETIKEAK